MIYPTFNAKLLLPFIYQKNFNCQHNKKGYICILEHKKYVQENRKEMGLVNYIKPSSMFTMQASLSILLLTYWEKCHC